MLNYKIIFKVTGILSFFLSILMIIPIFFEILYQDSNVFAFTISFFIILFFSGILYLSGYNSKSSDFSISEGILLIIASWLIIILIYALPYIFSEFKITFVDALLESVATVTTTGINLNLHYSKGFLILKSAIQVIGALMYIISILWIVEKLGHGYILSFTGQVSNILTNYENDNIKNKAIYLVKLYSLIIIIGCVILNLLNVNFFDSLLCITSCVSTSYINLDVLPTLNIEHNFCILLFSIIVIISGISSVSLIKISKFNFDIFDTQLKIYFFYISLTCIVTFYYIHAFGFSENLFSSIAHTIFYSATSITTTGVSAYNYIEKGSFLDSFLLFLNVIGGNSVSTTGGIKIIRILLLGIFIKNAILKFIKPEMVIIPTYSGKKIDDMEISNLLFYLTSLIILFLVFIFMLNIFGMQLNYAISSTFGALTNSGIFLGGSRICGEDILMLPHISKIILSVAMLCGKLEFVLFISVLMPFFWKR